MTRQRYHETTEKLDKCYKVVLQSSARGISADKIAEKLGVHRTTVYSYLNTLERMGKVESQQGIWRARTKEQTIQTLEKEIVIELPMPENQWQRIAALKVLVSDWEASFPETLSVYRASLETLREARTIRIRGKNVDDLDLEKLEKLIRQVNEKSSRFNLKRLFKRVRR